jgi:N-acetylglucosaminyl-diphospho-decaprenol L-rhamnosyltransferase
MKLSIVIVNWNTRQLLAGCLESIYATAEDVELDVWVVDNASTDGSPSMVRQQFPQVSLIENPTNVGFARANNQAIERSQGRYVLLLNSDTKVLAGALKSLVIFLDEHPQAGAIGSKLLNGDGSLQPSCHPMMSPEREFWRLIFLDNFIHLATYGPDLWKSSKPRQVQVLKGACIMLRREVLDQVGLLDEAYFMFTEEVDLCYRLAQKGWQLWWVPEANIIHYGWASAGQAELEMFIQLYRSKIQFFRKFGGEKHAVYYKRLLRLAYGPRLLFAAIGARFSPALVRYVNGFRKLFIELPNM